MPPTLTSAESAAQVAQVLRTTVSRLRRRLREEQESFDLSPSQTSVLSRLQQGGDVSASDLAAAERVRPQSVATTLTALVERGLIARRPDPSDGRRQLVSLTDGGREVVEGRRRFAQEWLTQALEKRFSEDERQHVLAALVLLDRLIQP